MRAWRAWISLLLLSSLSGCAETTAVVKTEYQFQYLPETFLAECPGVSGSERMTFREIAALAARRATALADCNARLARARAYQAEVRARQEAVMQTK